MNVWKSVLASLVILAQPCATRAEDWYQFRGPQTSGVADAGSPPQIWDGATGANIRWKTSLPRPGNGSPIVSAGRVFVTSAEDAEGQQRSLYCFDRGTGKQLWVRTVNYDQPSPTHQTNPYCGSTPASDGERVVVWHASAGLFCYDHEGQELWSRDLGQFEHMWGYGGSPIIHEGRVLLNCSPSKARTFVTAIDIQSGNTIWEVDEPMEGNGETNAAGHYMGSWSTPVLANVDGATQVIVAHPTRVVAYEPASGEILWWFDKLRSDRGDLAYSSPLCDGNICITIAGFHGPAMAVRLGGKGNITEDALWTKPQNPQSIGSGILRDNVFYAANAEPGTLQCLDATTGEERWIARSGAAIWGSIVAVGDLMYVTNQDGATIVFRHNPDKFERIAINKLNEASNSTPAIVGNEIFVRTMDALYCIAQ